MFLDEITKVMHKSRNELTVEEASYLNNIYKAKHYDVRYLANKLQSVTPIKIK